MRHTQIYIKVMRLYLSYEHFAENDMIFDSPVGGIDIFVQVFTILYYYVYNNPRNRGSILRLMNQQNYDATIFRTADFLREISNFDHVDVDKAQIFTMALL
jgi:hypothetical protein